MSFILRICADAAILANFAVRRPRRGRRVRAKKPWRKLRRSLRRDDLSVIARFRDWNITITKSHSDSETHVVNEAQERF